MPAIKLGGGCSYEDMMSGLGTSRLDDLLANPMTISMGSSSEYPSSVVDGLMGTRTDTRTQK